jgi:hypothetical protein
MTALGGLINKMTTDSTGLPRIPSIDIAQNQQIATRWYTVYFTRYFKGPLANPTTQAAGILYWTIQITEDGWQRAWFNFVRSTQPVADGVAALVAQLATQGDKGPGSPT